jgi:hypothetical protein
MGLMKQLLISFSGGLLLLCIWMAIVVLTSQDFAHEGPNSSWFQPVDAWSQVVVYSGFPRWVSKFSSSLGLLLAVVMLLGPFVLVFSVVVHLAVLLMHKMLIARKLK